MTASFAVTRANGTSIMTAPIAGRHRPDPACPDTVTSTAEDEWLALVLFFFARSGTSREYLAHEGADFLVNRRHIGIDAIVILPEPAKLFRNWCCPGLVLQYGRQRKRAAQKCRYQRRSVNVCALGDFRN